MNRGVPFEPAASRELNEAADFYDRGEPLDQVAVCCYKPQGL
jgi:hypothetical protein